MLLRFFHAHLFTFFPSFTQGDRMEESIDKSHNEETHRHGYMNKKMDFLDIVGRAYHAGKVTL